MKKIWIVVVLIGIFLIYQYQVSNKFSNVAIDGIPEEWINTEQEVVDFAKGIEEIKQYTQPLDDGCEPTFSSKYDNEKGTWYLIVGQECAGIAVRDYCYHLEFTPEGKIINKWECLV